MPNRNRYDLSHYSFMSGKIGRLMTLSAIPIVAGDSVMLNLAGAFRLSPLRRDLVMDAMVDLFAFFVPHRHIYGKTWTDFIVDGIEERATFPSMSFTDVDAQTPVQYLGYNRLDESCPVWLPIGYNQIWNRYFRVPNSTVRELPTSTGSTSLFLSTPEARNFGHVTARLKTFPTTGNGNATYAASDEQLFTIPVAGNSGVLDLVALNQRKAEFKTELERRWFGTRYTDVLERSWGGFATTDADQRPSLLMREVQWMSGYDIDGSADANLGQYAGKAATILDMNLPRRFFSEHGCLWLMGLVRFPTIWEKEVHYLIRKANPSFVEISGDSDVVGSHNPHLVNRWELFSGVASTDTVQLGEHPYGQWYRYHPSVVHSRFDELNGFPFLSRNPTNLVDAQYHAAGDYDDVFATSQLGHWRSQLRVNMIVDRAVPGPLRSIYAGTS